MRITGYDDFNWEAQGYWASTPDDFLPTVTVNPTVLYRTGALATFGPSQIGEMTIPVTFGYRGALTLEQWKFALIRQLRPLVLTPRQLRAVRNDGTTVYTNAVLMINGGQDGNDLNSVVLSFVSADALWFDQTTASASGSGS